MMIEEEEDCLFYASIRASETPSQKFYREQTPKEEMEQLGLIPDQYKEFSLVFSKSSFDELPEKRKWDHAIELKDDFKEKFTKVYPLNPHEQKQLDEFIEENLVTGRIRPSKSPMASPVFFIKKKDGSLRLIQDYRALNEMTIKNQYPLPLISELLDKLKKARYFTALDVRWDTIILGSKKEMNGKPLFAQIVDFTSQPSCSLPYQLTSNLPSNDERNLSRIDHRRIGRSLLRRHPYL